jgi:hypothetical protein
MHAETELGVAFQRLQEHPVAADMRFFDHEIEITDRLMGMDAEEQGDGLVRH